MRIKSDQCVLLHFTSDTDTTAAIHSEAKKNQKIKTCTQIFLLVLVRKALMCLVTLMDQMSFKQSDNEPGMFTHPPFIFACFH